MFRFVAIVAVLTVALLGRSQQPSPGPGKGANPPQKQTAQKPKEAKSGNDGPAALSVVVPVKTPWEAYKEGYNAGKSEIKSGPDIWTIVSDLSPLFVGLITAGLIWRQVSVMSNLNKLTKQSADAATKSANAANDGLEFAKKTAHESRQDVLAGLKASENLASAANRHARSAEKSLTLIERPWITHLEPMVVESKSGANAVMVAIENVGRSPAIMKSWGAKVYVGKLPKEKLVFSDLRQSSSFGAIAPVSGHGATIETEIPEPLPEDAVVILVSRIIYIDQFNANHITSDIWMLDFNTMRFTFNLSPDGVSVQYTQHT